ncbi:MAG: AbrB/MazE/SpoVT family DNA-binding domain-containing protein [Nanoarchaeota archaeon]
MKEKFVKAIRKNGDSLVVTIPSEVAELLKIREGNFLRVEIEKIKR